jgi:hypothetical protein
LTAVEFQDHLTGLDLTGITDAQLLDYIRQASRLVDSYIHGSFGVITMNERQRWTQARRFYPTSLPVHAARLLRLHIGGGQTADINPPDLFPNNQGGYIEVVSLATAVGLSAELVSLGLTEIVAELTYKTGGGRRSGEPSGVSYVANTTLTAALDESQTNVDVASAAALAVGDVIQVGAESMWIDAIVGITLTVVRAAQMNAVADTHLNGAAVSLLTLALDEEIELAVAVVVASLIAARRQNEEGVTGVRSFMIGAYSVSYGAKTQGGSGSGYPFIPDVAQMLLEPYRMVTLR